MPFIITYTYVVYTFCLIMPFTPHRISKNWILFTSLCSHPYRERTIAAATAHNIMPLKHKHNKKNTLVCIVYGTFRDEKKQRMAHRKLVFAAVGKQIVWVCVHKQKIVFFSLFHFEQQEEVKRNGIGCVWQMMCRWFKVFSYSPLYPIFLFIMHTHIDTETER